MSEYLSIGVNNVVYLLRIIINPKLMVAHQTPDFDFDFNLREELSVLDNHKGHREIPDIEDDKLLIATWNLTNFGLQNREDQHLTIMARICSYFDIVAIQEIADDLGHLNDILEKLGDDYSMLVTDIAGNRERLGYIYNNTKIQPTGMVAELAMRGYEKKRIFIQIGDEEESVSFEGFNRNPYMVTFKAGEFEFTLVNVHLYWSNYLFRRLETMALSKWAKKRVNKNFAPNNDIILIGDFNMERLSPNDDIYGPLVNNGLYVPKFDTNLVGTNLAGDSHYDEIAFFPSRTEEDFTDRIGVFDFDKVIFNSLWDEDDKDQKKKFYQYIRYFIADHRPLWCQFHINRNIV